MTSSHYNERDASQITGFSFVCSTVGSGADQTRNTSNFHVTGLCAGNSPLTYEFPAKRPVTRKMFPFDDVIMWLHRSGSTSTPVMAWCRAIPSLTAPSHYLNQCWLIAKCVLWHSSEKRFTRCAHEMNRNMCSGAILSKLLLGPTGLRSNKFICFYCEE